MTQALQALATALFAALAIVLSNLAVADFVATRWMVVDFTGEAWIIEPKDAIGQSQTFNRGFAEAVFFNCN